MTRIQSLGWILLGISAGLVAIGGMLDIQKQMEKGNFPISKRHLWNDGIQIAILGGILILVRD